MIRNIPYGLRLSIVACLTVVLTFNPAFAGRFFQCKPKASCAVACPPKLVCPPCAPVCCPCPPVADCGCAPKPACGCDGNPEAAAIGVVVTPDKPAHESREASEMPMTQDAPKQNEVATQESKVEADSSTPANDTTQPAVVAPMGTASDTPPKVIVPPNDIVPVQEATKPQNLTDDLFGDVTEVMEEDATPVDEVKEPTLLDDAEKDMSDATDVLSDDTEPAPSPSNDDLFGIPTEATEEMMEADEEMEEPTKEAADAEMDDLFGDPAPLPDTETPSSEDNTSIENLFDEPAPKPSDAPASENESGIEDLFGDLSDDEAVMPADADEMDELDNEPASDSTPVESTDDPAVPPTTDATDDLFDDLFSTPVDPKQPEPKKPPTSDDPLDDLFNSSGKPVTFRIIPNREQDVLLGSAQKTDFAGAERRVWRDNTGYFSTEGRLVQILPTEIRIEKANGKTCTVPVDRLSASDLRYVKWVAEALTQPNATKFVSVSK